MIEGPAFYPALTGSENLRVLATLGGFPQERVDELISLVGLKGRGGDKYKTYSLGMKQRLGIANALLQPRQLLILDEPTAGVDVEQRRALWTYLKELNKGGKTIILTSHYLEEIQYLCKEIAIINGGRIVAQGSPAELRHEIFGHTSYRVELAGDRATLAADLAEMMAGWNKIESAAKAQFPNATKEELYEITKSAMNHALGLK